MRRNFRRWSEEKLIISLSPPQVAYLGILAAWVILVVFAYTYALLMYERLGEGAEIAFAREWGIALGIDNALQLRGVVQDAVVTSVLLLAADKLGAVPTVSYLESTLDFMSCQATLLHGRATTWRERMQTQLDFTHRLRDE